jgi:imidazole glycerol-phosphate synthase subunit HisH
MNIVIIKYSAGNIQSVLYALQRLGLEAKLTDDPLEIRSADKVIFPGVGEASSAMNSLRAADLDKIIPALKQPVLGICVGMQLLFTHSEENDTECLGIIPAKVKKFEAKDIKVPQVGWNKIYDLRSPLFAGIEEGSYVYNVHSYYAEDNPFSIAHCHYGIEYSAAVQKDNFYGLQFHTEKSAENGDRILKNFIEI